MYSKIKFIASKYRSVLTVERLTELVRTSVTTYSPALRSGPLIQNYINGNKVCSKFRTLLKVGYLAPVTCASRMRLATRVMFRQPYNTGWILFPEVGWTSFWVVYFHFYSFLIRILNRSGDSPHTLLCW
jgi:hypothetical protein